MRQVVWNERTRETIKSFPEEVKERLGYLIYKLQLGENLSMPQSKNMPLIAWGTQVLRVKGKDGIYRIFYLKLDENKLIIFHAFKKKTQKTSQKEIKQGRKNLDEVIKWQRKI